MVKFVNLLLILLNSAVSQNLQKFYNNKDLIVTLLKHDAVNFQYLSNYDSFSKSILETVVSLYPRIFLYDSRSLSILKLIPLASNVKYSELVMLNASSVNSLDIKSFEPDLVIVIGEIGMKLSPFLEKISNNIHSHLVLICHGYCFSPVIYRHPHFSLFMSYFDSIFITSHAALLHFSHVLASLNLQDIDNISLRLPPSITKLPLIPNHLIYEYNSFSKLTGLSITIDAKHLNKNFEKAIHDIIVVTTLYRDSQMIDHIQRIDSLEDSVPSMFLILMNNSMNANANMTTLLTSQVNNKLLELNMQYHVTVYTIGNYIDKNDTTRIFDALHSSKILVLLPPYLPPAFNPHPTKLNSLFSAADQDETLSIDNYHSTAAAAFEYYIIIEQLLVVITKSSMTTSPNCIPIIFEPFCTNIITANNSINLTSNTTNSNHQQKQSSLNKRKELSLIPLPVTCNDFHVKDILKGIIVDGSNGYFTSSFTQLKTIFSLISNKSKDINNISKLPTPHITAVAGEEERGSINSRAKRNMEQKFISVLKENIIESILSSSHRRFIRNNLPILRTISFHHHNNNFKITTTTTTSTHHPIANHAVKSTTSNSQQQLQLQLQPSHPSSQRLLAVIIESRIDAAFEFSVRNVLMHLGSEWSLRVYHSTGITTTTTTSSNERFVRRVLQDISDRTVSFVPLPFPVYDGDTYNRLLKSENFWRELHLVADKVLLFQTDSLLLRRGIESFLHYDYIGAPWPITPEAKDFTWLRGMRRKGLLREGVGNGGLSLRSVAAMMKIAKLFGHKNKGTYEDVFFVIHLERMGYKLPSRQVAYQFAREISCIDLEDNNNNHSTVEGSIPLGIHSHWKYLSQIASNTLLNYSMIYPLEMISQLSGS